MKRKGIDDPVENEDRARTTSIPPIDPVKTENRLISNLSGDHRNFTTTAKSKFRKQSHETLAGISKLNLNRQNFSSNGVMPSA